MQRTTGHGSISGQPLRLIVVLAALLCASETNLYGYMDPGSAAPMWQVILSVAAGALFFRRRFITRIFSSVSRLKKRG